MSRILALLSFTCLYAFGQTASPAPEGKAVFEKNCALCHKPGADNRTPTDEALKRLSNQAVLVALETGSMKAQGAALSAAERRAVADFIAPRTAASSEPARENTCSAGAPPLANLNGWNGWGVDLVNSRLQLPKDGGIRAEDVPKLKVKWAFGFSGVTSVFGQPTAVGGRLF